MSGFGGFGSPQQPFGGGGGFGSQPAPAFGAQAPPAAFGSPSFGNPPTPSVPFGGGTNWNNNAAAAAPPSTTFGASPNVAAAASPFGQPMNNNNTTSFGGGFGSPQPAFGAQPQPPAAPGFGSPGFGNTNNNTGFGSNNNAGFGNNNTGFGQINNNTGGAFGNNTGFGNSGFGSTNNSNTGGFGGNSNNNSGFNNSTGFGNNNNNTGFGTNSGVGFGNNNNNNNTTGFGTSNNTGFGGGFGNNSNNNTTGFGTTPFGQTQNSTTMNTSNNNNNTAGNPFGGGGSANTAAGGGGGVSFGMSSNVVTTGGGFGNNNNNNNNNNAWGQSTTTAFGASNNNNNNTPFGAPSSSDKDDMMADGAANNNNNPFGGNNNSNNNNNNMVWPPPPNDNNESDMQDASGRTGVASPVPEGQMADTTTTTTSSSSAAPATSQEDKLARLKAKLEEKKKKMELKKKMKGAAGGISPPQSPKSSSSLNPEANPFAPFQDKKSNHTEKTKAFLPDDLKEENNNNNTNNNTTAMTTAEGREDLANATSLVGTCRYMCPDEELVRRQSEGDIQLLELPLPGTLHPAHWTLRETTVKRFRRSAADYKLDVPEWVRPPDVLERVCSYLEEWIMERDRQGGDPRFPQQSVPPSLDVYQFVWDRTRMVRKDFILQNYIGAGGKCDARAVRCHERIARWHAMCEHQLSHIPDFVKMQSQQNIQELGQTMKTLNQYYDDDQGRSLIEVDTTDDDTTDTTPKQKSRNTDEEMIHGCSSDFVKGKTPMDYDGKTPLNNDSTSPSSNVSRRLIGKHAGKSPTHGTAEPEMRGLYILLTMNNDGGMEVLKYAAHLFRERPDVYHSKPVQLALNIYKAKKEYNYVRFFSILRDAATPYLFSCIMFKHVEMMRKAAFRIMSKTYGARKRDTGEAIYDAYPLKKIEKLLCFEDLEEARKACKHYNVTVKEMKIRSSSSPTGSRVEEIIQWRHSDFTEPKDPDKGNTIPLRPKKMVKYIESKLNGVTRLAVCRGEVSGDGAALTSVVGTTTSSTPTAAPAVLSSSSTQQPLDMTANNNSSQQQEQQDSTQQPEEKTDQQKEEEAANAKIAAMKAEMLRRKEEKERVRREQEEAEKQKKEAEERRRLEILAAEQKEKERIEAQKRLEEEQKRRLEEEKKKQEMERLKREQELKERQERARREEIARKEAAEKERRRLLAEAAEARKKAEKERIRKEEEERRRRLEEEEKQRKFEEQERLLRKKEEEERQRREARMRLEQQRLLQEEERKRKEEAAALALERKVDAARKLLIFRRLRQRIPPRKLYATSDQSLRRIDPTFAVREFSSTLDSFVVSREEVVRDHHYNNEASLSSFRGDKFNTSTPSCDAMRNALDKLLLEEKSLNVTSIFAEVIKTNYQELMRNSLKTNFENRRMANNRDRRPEGGSDVTCSIATILFKVAIILPEPNSLEEESFCELVHGWLKSRIRYNEVMISEIVDLMGNETNGVGRHGQGRIRPCQIRTVFVKGHCNGVCDMALVVIPPPWTTVGAWTATTKRVLSDTFRRIDNDIPIVSLVLGEDLHANYYDSTKCVLSECCSSSGRDEFPIVFPSSLERTGLDGALESSCRVLMESFIELFFVDCKDEECPPPPLVERVSLMTLGYMCICDAMWKSNYLGGSNGNHYYTDFARETLNVLMKELEEAETTIKSTWSDWPAKNFASADNSSSDDLHVKGYFGSNCHLPMAWASYLVRERVEPAIMDLSGTFHGSITAVMEKFLINAPMSIREECETMIQKQQFRRCIQRLLLYREEELSSTTLFDQVIYLPKGMLEVIVNNTVHVVLQSTAGNRLPPPTSTFLQQGIISGSEDEAEEEQDSWYPSGLESSQAQEENAIIPLVEDGIVVAEIKHEQNVDVPSGGMSSTTTTGATNVFENSPPPPITTPQIANRATVNASVKEHSSLSSQRWVPVARTKRRLHDDERNENHHIDNDYQHNPRSQKYKRSRELEESAAYTKKLEALLRGDLTIDMRINNNTSLKDMLRGAPPLG